MLAETCRSLRRGTDVAFQRVFVIAGGISTDVGRGAPVVLVRAGKSVARHTVRTHGLAVITLKNFAIA
jgi:hypothetical protein